MAIRLDVLIVGMAVFAEIWPLTAWSAPAAPTTAPSSLNRVFLDVDGGGIDLSRCDVSSKRRALPTTAGDRMLVIDVAAAALAGFKITSSKGAAARFVPFGSGVRLTLPSGTAHETDDGWALLALLETTRDGVLDKRDLVFPALRLARDTNSNGIVDDDEVILLAERNIVGIGARAPVTTERDKNGNELAYGVFTRGDGTLDRMADVALARCE